MEVVLAHVPEAVVVAHEADPGLVLALIRAPVPAPDLGTVVDALDPVLTLVTVVMLVDTVGETITATRTTTTTTTIEAVATSSEVVSSTADVAGTITITTTTTVVDTITAHTTIVLTTTITIKVSNFFSSRNMLLIKSFIFLLKDTTIGVVLTTIEVATVVDTGSRGCSAHIHAVGVVAALVATPVVGLVQGASQGADLVAVKIVVTVVKQVPDKINNSNKVETMIAALRIGVSLALLLVRTNLLLLPNQRLLHLCRLYRPLQKDVEWAENGTIVPMKKKIWYRLDASKADAFFFRFLKSLFQTFSLFFFTFLTTKKFNKKQG